MGIAEILTAPHSPWQMPFAERLIGSIRRECLDHVLVLSERHLRRILTRYFAYYHRARTHLSLDKDAPDVRPIERPELAPSCRFPKSVACIIFTSGERRSAQQPRAAGRARVSGWRRCSSRRPTPSWWRRPTSNTATLEPCVTARPGQLRVLAGALRRARGACRHGRRADGGSAGAPGLTAACRSGPPNTPRDGLGAPEPHGRPRVRTSPP
jgi:hypothetical protein